MDDTARSTARSGRRRWIAVTATVAVVAVVAAVAARAATRGGTQHRGPAQRVVADRRDSALPGTAWRLTSVRTASAPAVAIPERLHAGVVFDRDGAFGANDGVNRYGGRYRTTGRGVVIDDVAGTLVGYAGDDPAVEAAVLGITSLHGTASTSVEGSTLTVHAGSSTLTFTRADIDPGFTGRPTTR